MSDRTFAQRLASAEENIANHDKAIHGDVATQIGYLVRRLAWLEEQLGVEPHVLGEPDDQLRMVVGRCRVKLAAQIRDLHTRDTSEGTPLCAECSKPWPCRTWQACHPKETP